MAEFQKIAKESKRICETYKTCDGCPIKTVNKGVLCLEWILRNPEEAESIIMKWTSEHPITTNGMKFREVFGVDCTEPILCDFDGWLDAEYKKVVEYENDNKSVQPGRIPVNEKNKTEKIENILQYIDEKLHPIISPEHWNVYSELHDMISGLLTESQ